MKQYDVVFLGSGHAAWHAALTLKQSGKQVAIVEKDTIAGTSLPFPMITSIPCCSNIDVRVSDIGLMTCSL